MKTNPILCDQCGACVSVCPSNALILSENQLEFNASKCSNCLKCAMVCPTGSLQLTADSLQVQN